MNVRIAIYDFEACRPALEAHAKELAENEEGLARWASLRDFIEKFAQEAFAHDTCVLGQFDPDLVFAFVPVKNLPANQREMLWVDVLERSRSMMGGSAHPYWIDFLDAITGGEGPKAAALRYSWIEPSLLQDVLLPQKLAIWVFFNAKRFVETTLLPQLHKRGFVLVPHDSEEEHAPLLRVKHPSRPTTIFRIPWDQWFREMVGGGYNFLYLLAFAAIYLQKLEQAVAESGEKEG
ncbi:MAG: hypothetical protein N2Z21_10575 [Candidatus Sumerlaeaceae bacterium]|nr:hypothetical protein [Candidatus Sumerlaeaceae bacterium]